MQAGCGTEKLLTKIPPASRPEATRRTSASRSHRHAGRGGAEDVLMVIPPACRPEARGVVVCRGSLMLGFEWWLREQRKGKTKIGKDKESTLRVRGADREGPHTRTPREATESRGSTAPRPGADQPSSPDPSSVERPPSGVSRGEGRHGSTFQA